MFRYNAGRSHQESAALRIWIVNATAASPREGAGTRHYDFARELNARGHDVTLIGSSVGHLGAPHEGMAGLREPKVEIVDGVRFVWLPGVAYKGSGARRLIGMLDFARRVWRGRWPQAEVVPDVVLGSSPHPFGAFAAMRLAKRINKPFVLEIRDVWPASLTTTGKVKAWHPLVVLLGWMEVALHRGAAFVVTLLPGTPNHIARRGGSLDRIAWVSNGADLNRIGDPTPQPDRSRLDVCYVGTVGLWYGIDVAIDAMALIHDLPQARDVSLTFIGGGTEEARLKADCEARGLDRVRFLGRIPKAAVPATIAGYDACMAIVKDAPLYREGGVALNKLFDAFAAARPVLFASSAYNDPVTDAGAGLTSPGGDARALADNILALAAMTPEQRAVMGLAGRRHVAERYSLPYLTDRLEAVFRSVVPTP